MSNERNNINNHPTKTISTDLLNNELDVIARRVVTGDKEFISELMSETVRLQRYLVMVLMQLTENMESKAAEEVMSLYLVVWGTYRQVPACRGREITPSQFRRLQKHNISMLRYLDGEEDDEQFSDIVNHDRQGETGQCVMRYVAASMQEWPALAALDENAYGAVLIIIKTMVACFEELAGN